MLNKKELSSYLCCNSNYDVKAAEKQLCYAKEDDDKERIDYWKNQVEIRLEARSRGFHLVTSELCLLD